MEPTSAHLPAGSAASQPLPPPAALGGAVFQALSLLPPAFSGCVSEPVLWKMRQRK